MTDVDDVSSERASHLVAEVDRLRARVRRAPGPPWFPLVFFGGVTVASAALLYARAGIGELPLWAGAGILGMRLTGRHYARRGRGGVTRRDRRTEMIAVALFCVCLVVAVVAGDLGGVRASLEAVIVVVAIAYVVISWRVRSPAAAGMVCATSALALALAAGGVASWALELVFGVGLVLSGAGLRILDRTRPS